MSCLGPGYDPTPPRRWIRYQNQCSKPYAPSLSLEEILRLQMANKGNILQYKKNSSRWTKSQKYSYIANRQFTSWASQSETNSDPNIGLLDRVNSRYIIAPNSSNIIDNSTITSIQDINCIQTGTVPVIVNKLPQIGTGGQPQPTIPPQPTSSSNNTVNILPKVASEGNTLYVIKDGGSLICNKIVNPCSGEVLQKSRNRICYPTTCSDVPGIPTLLCWSNREPTYFPKVKRTYGTSNNKWPYNAKFIRAAKTKPITTSTVSTVTSIMSL